MLCVDIDLKTQCKEKFFQKYCEHKSIFLSENNPSSNVAVHQPTSLIKWDLRLTKLTSSPHKMRNIIAVIHLIYNCVIKWITLDGIEGRAEQECT